MASSKQEGTAAAAEQFGSMTLGKSAERRGGGAKRGSGMLLRKSLIHIVSFIGLSLFFVRKNLQNLRSVAETNNTENIRAYVVSQNHGGPLYCNDDQLNTIRKHLPPDDCNRYKEKPWLQKCSFTQTTKCPDNQWLEEYFEKGHQQSTKQGLQKEEARFLSIFVGCNKGMDAVNALRMGSGDSRFDKKKWIETLTSGGRMKLHNDVCGQASTSQFPLAPDNGGTKHIKSEVHCIEPMPATAKELDRAARELGWTEKGFIVTHAAIGRNNGIASFPSTSSIGVENKGLENGCDSGHCEDVTVYSLDSYIKHHVPPHPIDYLSIDVEGFDFDVLLSGLNSTLSKVRYLEFEYNWMGSWKYQSLYDAVHLLDRIGFTCYWAGNNGLLWQITNCWLEHYHVHAWSNVACISRNDRQMRSVAENMQERFLSTLALGETFHG